MTFEEIRAMFKDYTAVCDDRQRLIYDLVKRTKDVPGDMIEVGVYRGGTSLLIANTDPNRRLYACDTFTGLPKPSALDTHSEGDFKDTSYEAVKELLAPYPQVTVIKGLFPDGLLHAPAFSKPFSFAHIDVDLHYPTFDCLDVIYRNMSSGGVIVVDDYGMPSCPGVKLAVDSFELRLPERFVDSGFKSCYIIKP